MQFGLLEPARKASAPEPIREAVALVERSEARSWCAELYRLRRVFLSAMGADDTQIETCICAAIKTAKGQKSVSLQKHAEGKPGLRNLGAGGVHEKSAVNLRDF
jgi:hypothetical protein